MARIIAVRTLVGTDVSDQSGESIGTVRDVILNVPERRVAFTVVELGGRVGGRRMVAVPIDRLRLLSESESLLLDADLETLEDASALGAERWPSSADVAFRAGT
jgi:sporulation protein YlmC with PRC-barrel domain